VSFTRRVHEFQVPSSKFQVKGKFLTWNLEPGTWNLTILQTGRFVSPQAVAQFKFCARA
jgi:hypothetical protein